jgi:hypothetical protein
MKYVVILYLSLVLVFLSMERDRKYPISWKKLTTEEGLSSNTITDIVQDDYLDFYGSRPVTD